MEQLTNYALAAKAAPGPNLRTGPDWPKHVKRRLTLGDDLQSVLRRFQSAATACLVTGKGETMAILGVLFDKDGTFVDFDATYGPATHAVIHRLAKGDMRIMQRQADALQFLLETQRFLPASPLIAGSTLDYGAPWAKALGRTDLAALAAQIDALLAEAALSALTPLGDPARLMPNLRAAGFRLGVATNDSEASARRQIEALGLQEEFVFVAGYDSGHSQKPAPGMALAFARHIEASPAQIAMVGDSVHDLCCARAAGAKAVGVLTGPANAEQLAPYADALLKSIAELPAWLASA